MGSNSAGWRRGAGGTSRGEDRSLSQDSLAAMAKVRRKQSANKMGIMPSFFIFFHLLG